MTDRELIEALDGIRKLTLLQAKNYLNVDDACLYLGVNKSTIYRMMREKVLPYSKPRGKLAFFKKSDLDIWASGNRIASASELEEKAARYCLTN